MAKFIEINGEYFEVIHTAKLDEMLKWHGKDYLGRRTLYDFYDNPSETKERIWADWREWAAQAYPKVCNMYVTGASCFSFSIGAYYCDPKTTEILGYIKITKDHNRLYVPKGNYHVYAMS